MGKILLELMQDVDRDFKGLFKTLEKAEIEKIKYSKDRQNLYIFLSILRILILVHLL